MRLEVSHKFEVTQTEYDYLTSILKVKVKAKLRTDKIRQIEQNEKEITRRKKI